MGARNFSAFLRGATTDDLPLEAGGFSSAYKKLYGSTSTTTRTTLGTRTRARQASR
jgi:hypothetical protein